MAISIKQIKEYFSTKAIVHSKKTSNIKPVVMTGILIILILIGSIYYSYIKPNSIVDVNDLKDYSNGYLAEYNELIEQYFGHEYGYYFKFYNKYPYIFKSIVSTQNGVATEIIPSLAGTFELKTTNDKIEDAVLEKNLFNNPEIHISDGKNYTILRWEGAAGGAMFQINNVHDVIFKGGVIFTNQGRFMDFGNSTLLLSDIIVDDIYYNLVYFNGCNKKKCWTKEVARQRALSDLKEIGLQSSFIVAFDRNEFREYFAYPELIPIITDIIYKAKYDSEYRYDEMINDIKKVQDIGIKKYGVSNEYINNVINFTNSKIVLKKELPLLGIKYENNWLYSIEFFFFVLIGFLSGFIAKKIKIPDDIGEGLKQITPLVIYFYSLQEPPLEYTTLQKVFPLIPILLYILYFNMKTKKLNIN